MGQVTMDEHRPFKVGEVVRLIDREIGAQANRYFLRAGALELLISQADDGALLESASMGATAFEADAQVRLGAFWTQLSSGARSDLFGVYVNGAAVQRWLERQRGSPAFFDRGPDLTQGQAEALVDEALTHGFAQFDPLAAAIVGPWWSGLPPLDRQTFYASFRAV